MEIITTTINKMVTITTITITKELHKATLIKSKCHLVIITINLKVLLLVPLVIMEILIIELVQEPEKLLTNIEMDLKERLLI